MNIINNQYNNHTSFKTIKLNKKELLESKKLLNKYIKASDSELKSLNNEAFKFFEKHLHKEIDLKTNFWHIKEDFAQDLYLEFFILLNNIRKKTLSKNDFISKINEIKPNKNCLKHNLGLVSLSSSINYTNLEQNDFITEMDLPVYTSKKNEQENFKNVVKLDKIIEKSCLTEEEKFFLKNYSNSKMAKELNVQKSSITHRKDRYILKIQNKTGNLPLQLKNLAKKLKEKYALELPLEKIYKSLSTDSYFMSADENKLFEKIYNASKILETEEKRFVLAAIKHPPLFFIKPDKLSKNLEENAKNLNIKQEDFIEAAFALPSIFYREANVIYNNLKKIAQALNVDIKEIIDICLKQQTLFVSNTDSAIKKIKIMKYLKQVKGKEDSKIAFSTDSNDLLFKKLITFFVQKHFNFNKLAHGNLIETLKSHPDENYKFELPESEFNEEFMEFTKNLFKKTLGKSNVEFIIKNKS
ncbi:hypothetical protein J6R97_02505 [bacterium]|nr:hypothetical protein [bacterium]